MSISTALAPPIPEPVSCEGSSLTFIFILSVALVCAVFGCGCGLLTAAFGRRCLANAVGGFPSAYPAPQQAQSVLGNPLAAVEDLRGEAQRQVRLVRSRDGASR